MYCSLIFYLQYFKICSSYFTLLCSIRPIEKIQTTVLLHNALLHNSAMEINFALFYHLILPSCSLYFSYRYSKLCCKNQFALPDQFQSLMKFWNFQIILTMEAAAYKSLFQIIRIWISKVFLHFITNLK